MTQSLKDTLKEIQILLGRPEKKIADSIKYYTNLLNITEDGDKDNTPSKKRGNMQTIKHNKITWVEIINPTRGVIGKLAEQYPFHPLHLEDCLSKWQFPKIEESDEDKYLFLLLRFPHLNVNLDKMVIHQICFFLGKDYLVTIHEDQTDAISNIFNECKENLKEREAYISNSSSHLLYVIIDQLTRDLSSTVQLILKGVEEVEDIVFDDKLSGVFKIGQLRQKIIGLRRVISPLRTLLVEMETQVNKFTSSNLSVYFDNIIHRVEKGWETLEEARETVEIYKDADFTFSTEKTNKILAVLTIIFTLSIPATVVGSLYGMNILLPGGLEAGNWTFWGKYTSFIILLLTATIPPLLMYWYFRKRGWF